MQYRLATGLISGLLVAKLNIMRSRNEQENSAPSERSRELRLLYEVTDAPDITQRQLSQKLGIALGLTNMLIRNLTRKGYLRVSKASWKRRLYTLTPEGFSHRIHLMTGYINRFVSDYRRVRNTLREQLDPLALNAESRIAIYGTGEFAELVYMGIRDVGIEEIDIFMANESDHAKFLGISVRDVALLSPDEYDWVLVGQLANREEAQDMLQARGVRPDRLITFFEDGSMRNGR